MEPRTDQQTGRRRILVVDGDAPIQRLLDVNLRSAGFEVQTVATVTEGLAAVATARPDLIFSETRFADGPDGFDFCKQLKQAVGGAGSIAFVFLAEQTMDSKLRAVEAGADDFLAKPVYVQEVVARARALLQRRERDRLEALTRGDEPFTGALDVLPLADLLRAIAANRRSGVAHLVAPGGGRGDIYCRDGAVVDAEIGRLSGLDALCRLFSWSEGAFEIEWKSIRRKDAVAMEPGALLMEALRRLDEWRRLLAELPADSTIFEVDYHLLAERLAEIPDEVNSILRLFDGQRTLMRVIDDCGFPDLDALAVIGKLFREQIIRDARTPAQPALTPGADMEGWIADALGPFRGGSTRERRDLFGPSTEVSGVHGRVTAPVEPLDEGGRDVVAAERRERFTDRLIAEGAAPTAGTALATTTEPISGPIDAPETTRMGLAPPVMTAPFVPPTASRTPPFPRMAPETTRMGMPPPPPVPASSAAPPPATWPERTQQGLALSSSSAPLSTKPGFEAAAAAPPRLAQAMPVDVTPQVRTGETSGAKSVAEGIPQTIVPQRPEPGIIIPAAAAPSLPDAVAPAPEVAPASEVAPPSSVGASPDAASIEPRSVAGEILARASTEVMDSRSTADQGGGARRNTDLGLGPDRPLDVAGELAAIVVREPAKADPALVVRKIILDPDVPEEEEAPRSSRGVRWLIMILAAAVPLVIGILAFKLTGRHTPVADVVDAAAARAPIAAPIAEAPVAAAAEAVAVVDGAPTSASAPPSATAGHTHASPQKPAASDTPPVRPVLDERGADPKVARALPSEFAQLLVACRTAFADKRAKDAELACLAAKDANPASPEACVLLAHALFNRKKRHEAVQWATRALELDANQAEAYVIIGGVKQSNDDAHGAKAAYKKYLELAPTGQYAADLRAIVDSL
ncbi:MAG: response regulator receiver protein [Myxococcales bacterium]|nr:response regulator receiver protein [Myxococcales bacterium]